MKKIGMLFGKERSFPLAFIEREMLSDENGFYSALDADSEGVEGKFYTWSQQEIDDLLGHDAKIFSALYDVSEKGNWEGPNSINKHLLKALFPNAQIKLWKDFQQEKF